MAHPALNRKLIRDLWHVRGQAAAIAMVVASGVAIFVMSVNMLISLGDNQQAYYDRYRFADVFAQIKRAPDPVADRIRAIPGVAAVDTRIVDRVTLDIEGMSEPANAKLVSIPAHPEQGLNRLYLRQGQLPDNIRSTQVVINESFAETHDLSPGDQITAVLNGKRQDLGIVGIALSPEYIITLPEGELLPDDKHYAVIWMGRSAMEAAFNMEGGFNDISLTLLPGVNTASVIDQVDALLAPYGGVGAYDRDDQASHEFVSNEIEELRGMAILVPAIFLAVAAFLLHVVMGRLIHTQREQIAALKAFGYPNRVIAMHYAGFVLVIVLCGAALGVGAGAYLGRGLTRLYTEFFHFPLFLFRLDPRVLVGAVAVAFCAGAFAAYSAVRSIVSLPPAEAMRPEPPADYRRTLIERMRLERILPVSTRMILRQLERRWGKSLVACLGIAAACAILVLGSFSLDSIDYVMDAEFGIAQRQDVSVVLAEKDDTEALYNLARLPGVRQVEGFRIVPARISHNHRSRRLAITGLDPDAELFRLVDLQKKTVPLDHNGVVLSAKLAEVLGVNPGDSVTISVLEGERPVTTLTVAQTIEDFTGLAAYLPIDDLNALMREGQVVSGAHLSVDTHKTDVLYRELKQTPHVTGVTLKAAALQSFADTVAENLLRIRLFNIGFACVIAFGVVYNTVRISLSERGRELATLRVIGFHRSEVSTILLGELAVLTIVAIPLGLALGYGLARMVVHTTYNTELFRIPLVVGAGTYAFAGSVVLAAAVVSGLIVRRRIDKLDLVAVLKSRE